MQHLEPHFLLQGAYMILVILIKSACSINFSIASVLCIPAPLDAQGDRITQVIFSFLLFCFLVQHVQWFLQDQ